MDRGTEASGAQGTARDGSTRRQEAPDATRRARLGDFSRGAARGGRSAARGTRRVAVGGARRVRRMTYAQGAGESGLGRLIELHGVNTMGDAMIAVSLANTLFFSVPTGEARGRVALYLLITMAPFAVMAPVIGPLLDRFRHGRRWAIALTLLVRAFLAWVLAGAVADEGLSLYPAAFGCLVGSKAYGVTRSATVPRLLPAGGTLVAANSRISLAGIVAGATGAGLAAALALIGPEWSLRGAFVVFAIGVVLALRLPAKVDSTVGETLTTISPLDDTGPIPRSTTVGPAVVTALRANGALRAFSGFLTLFFAFLLREHPIGGLSNTVAIGVVAGAAGIGSTAGTTIGSRLRSRPEAVIVVVLSILTAAALAGAFLYQLVTVIAVALAAGLAQSLGKLSLDAIVQRDVEEAVRTSAFARSETLLQLSWVVGGGVGIALPLNGRLGLSIAAAGLVVMLALTLRELVQVRRARRPRTSE